MNLVKLALAASMLLCLAASAVAQDARPAPAARPDSSRVFLKARAVGDEAAPSAFEFELSGYSYHIAANGAGRRTKGDDVRRFNLRLDGVESIQQVYYQEYRDNVLLVCRVGDGDGGAAFVARIQQPSMRARWKQRVPALGVAATREDDSLYVTGLGFIGRLDLRTGEYLWQHDDEQSEARDESEARERGAAPKVVIPSAYYEPPEFKGGAVIFREDKAFKTPPLKAIHVNKKSGKIIRIE